MKLQSNWRDSSYYKIEDDKKIYYIGKDKVGEEYYLVRELVFNGYSSSNAHKMIGKIKEQKE